MDVPRRDKVMELYNYVRRNINKLRDPLVLLTIFNCIIVIIGGLTLAPGNERNVSANIRTEEDSHEMVLTTNERNIVRREAIKNNLMHMPSNNVVSLEDSAKNAIIIRNPFSGLVLDGTGSIVHVNTYHNLPGQRWFLQHASLGKFYIVNEANLKVLAFQDFKEGGNVILSNVISGSEYQLWYIRCDSTIMTVPGEFALNVYMNQFTEGQKVVIHGKRSGDKNQHFVPENV